jgi:RNA polymerase sigma factor (sigma-70 family)
MEMGLHLVRFATSEYQGFLLGSDEDVLGIGMIGLAKAIEQWDPKKKNTWLHYTRIKIRGEILAYLLRDRRYTGATTNPCNIPWLTSTDMVNDANDKTNITSSRDSGTMRMESSDSFDHLIRDLHGDEREAVVSVYYDGDTLDELAASMNTDRTQASNLLRSAMSKLRKKGDARWNSR